MWSGVEWRGEGTVERGQSGQQGAGQDEEEEEEHLSASHPASKRDVSMTLCGH